MFPEQDRSGLGAEALMGRKGNSIAGLYSFGIDWKGFFKKLSDEHRDLKNRPGSVRHALNFAFTAWHLKEWLWADRFKDNKAEQQAILGEQFDTIHQFNSYLFRLCPELKLLGEICDGTKHFGPPRKTTGIKLTGSKMNLVVSSALGVAQLGGLSLGAHEIRRSLFIETDQGDQPFMNLVEIVMKFYLGIRF